MILEEMINDPEVYFSALEERGRSGGGHSGRTDTGAGDRAVAEKTRISGLDQLRPMLTHLNDALRAGGWDDSVPLEATVGADTHDEAPGRDWSLRGAVAEARIVAKAAKPDAPASLGYTTLQAAVAALVPAGSISRLRFTVVHDADGLVDELDRADTQSTLSTREQALTRRISVVVESSHG